MKHEEMRLYVAAKLCFADVPDWGQIINTAQKDRKVLAHAYEPLRHAVMAELEVPGNGPLVLERGLRRLRLFENLEDANRNAFARFQSLGLESNGILAKEVSSRTMLGPVTCHGSFHADVNLKRRGAKLIYILGAERSDEERKALAQLLVQLAESMGRRPSDVLILDLNHGNLIKGCERSSVRKRLDQLGEVWHLIQKGRAA